MIGVERSPLQDVPIFKGCRLVSPSVATEQAHDVKKLTISKKFDSNGKENCF